jgi:hypothetical protein
MVKKKINVKLLKQDNKKLKYLQKKMILILKAVDLIHSLL